MKYDEFTKPYRRLIKISMPNADFEGKYFPRIGQTLWMLWEQRSDQSEWGQLFENEASAKQKMDEYHRVPDEYSGGGYVENPEN